MAIFWTFLCLAAFSSLVTAVEQRTDPRFVGYELPAVINQCYKPEEWYEYITKNYDISKVDDVQKVVKNYLTTHGVEDAANIPTNIGTSIRLDLDTIPGLCNATLTLHTLGKPVHRGSLFYPEYNTVTKRAIEKSMDTRDYTYGFVYALMNRTYVNSRVVSNPLYRGVNAPFDRALHSYFRFNEFAPATEVQSLAKDYLGAGGSLFQIENARAYPVYELSQYPTEKEYLIHPFEVYRVSSITPENHAGGTINRVVLVKIGVLDDLYTSSRSTTTTYSPVI